MTTIKERETILDSIEDDYRRDLSLHLYSTFLYHQINPLFPRRNWASWPLPFDQVPDPRTTKKYVDSYFPKTEYKDIGQDYDMENPEINTNMELNDEEVIEPEGSGNANFDDSIEGELEDDRDTNQYMRIRSVATQETLSNSKIDMMIELRALLERKIHSKLKAMQKRPNSGMSADISSQLTDDICKKLANKVDGVFDNLINFQKQGHVKMTSTRPYPRLLNWQDVLLAGLDLDESHDQILDPTSYSKLYKKCETLFVNAKYDYEYESEDENNESENDQAEQSLVDFCDDSVASSSTVKPSFNYLDYLSRMEETHLGVLNYKNFKERILKSRDQETKLKDIKKMIFMRKLQLQYKYSEISWDKEKKRPRNKDGSVQKKFRIQNYSRDSQRQDALLHGGLQLTAEDFKINM